MVTSGKVRLVAVVAALCVLISSGCGDSESKTVQQVVSSDGQYWARVHQDPSSFLVGRYWYAAEIGPVHPKWFEVLSRMRGVEAWTLQGRGAVGISWAGPRKLVVECSGCDRKNFFVFKPGAQEAKTKYGVKVEYRFVSSQNPPGRGRPQPIKTSRASRTGG